MSEQEKKKKIEELTAQLTPRGAFEAMRGFKTPEGVRFSEAYEEIRRLEESRT